MQYFGGAADVDLAYDIIDQPGHNTINWLSGNGATFNVSYVLSSSTAGLPQNNPSVIQGAPPYVDGANGDYHLAPLAQLAIDFGHGANFDSYTYRTTCPATPISARTNARACSPAGPRIHCSATASSELAGVPAQHAASAPLSRSG